MITPVKAQWVMPDYTGPIVVKAYSNAGQITVGSSLRVGLLISRKNANNPDIVMGDIVLTRGQAQQLADDINFLLG